MKQWTFLIALLISCQGSANGEVAHDLRAQCGFSVVSRKKLESVSADYPCTLNYSPEGGFFAGYVSSDKEILKKHDPVGIFKFKDGKPQLTRVSYVDSNRDVSQEVIKSIQLRPMTKAHEGYVFATLVRVEYEKPIPPTQELNAVTEIYECWDALLFGKRTGVVVLLCDRLASEENFPSKKSWQADVIGSVQVN